MTMKKVYFVITSEGLVEAASATFEEAAIRRSRLLTSVYNETGTTLRIEEAPFISPGMRRVYRCKGCDELKTWCNRGSDDLPHHCVGCCAVAHMPWWAKLLRFKPTRHRCSECSSP